MKSLELIGHVDAEHNLHAIVPDDVPPGQFNVLLTLPDSKMEQADDWDALNKLIDACSGDAGPEDLAHQHDHYLHGKPKKDDWTP